MRTTLDIDDGLMDSLMARYPGASKTEAVERAIAGYLAEDAASWLRAQAGTVEFDEAGWREGREADRRRGASQARALGA